MPKDTIYLQQAYKSLEKVLSELTDDNFQNTERNQSADLFKRIDDKIKEETKLSALTQLAKSSPISQIDINLLLINPLYKDNVADLASQLNLDHQHFEEFKALELIIQHLKEFIELSHLADVAADASPFQKIRHFNLLKTLGSMAKLQFTVLLTDVERFLSHCQHENDKIKTISVGLIDYLNESAVAEIDFSTATFLKNYYQTDSETLQASFKEDKASFNNEFNTYLNSFKPEDKKNQSNDISYYPCSSTQEENQSEEIFYDACSFIQEEHRQNSLHASQRKIKITLKI